MCQVGLVSNDERLAESLVHGLQGRAGCEVTSLRDHEFYPASRAYPFNLLLLSWQTNEHFPKLIEDFSYRQPESMIILMMPVELGPPFETLIGLGVDEVFILPENKQQLTVTLKWLSQKIVSLINLQTLQAKVRHEMRQSQIVAKSRAMKEIICQLPRLAAWDSTVLVAGETGTGKELIARAIHYLGPRASQPFIVVDCGALPENLVENELFGHARGAYTDAGASAKGMIEEAEGGTLFLDEVQTLPLATQSKFLRFLQEHQYKRLGQTKYVAANVRVIAATNIDLTAAIAQKEFRADLYYRLNVMPLYIPPLRARRADIPGLVQHFLNKYAPEAQPPSRMRLETMRSWQAHDWPGNVRELENRVQHWLTQANEESEETSSLDAPPPKSIRTLAEVRSQTLAVCERNYLQELMDYAHGNLSLAARYAGIHRKSLAGLLKKYHLEARKFRGHSHGETD